MNHHCHAEGCGKPVPPKLLMCLAHWKMVAPALKRLVWAFYKPGQETRKDPSPGYMIVQAIAVGWVAVESGQWTQDECDNHILRRMQLFAPKLTKDDLALFWRLNPKVAQMVAVSYTHLT